MINQDKKIFVICRIRRSKGSHLATPGHKHQSSSERNLSGSLRANSPNQSKMVLTSPKFSGNREEKNNIFASQQADNRKEGKLAQMIAAQENPIKQSLIEQYIKTDQDIEKYKQTLLGGANVFKVHRVYGPKITQDKFYNSVFKDRIKSSFEGNSNTFIFMGPTGGGKRYSFRGGENEEKGSVIAAAEQILQNQNLGGSQARIRSHFASQESVNSNVGGNQQYQIFVQIFAVFNNEIIDLIKDKKFRIDEEAEEGTSKVEIKQLSEFKSLYRSSINNWIQLNSTHQCILDDSHLFVRFNVCKNKHVLSKINFVKTSCFQQNTDEFNSLASYLSDISNSKPSRILSNPDFNKHLLIRCLIESLNRLDEHKAVVINCVSGHPIPFDSTLYSLQYVHNLKEKVNLNQEEANQIVGPTFSEIKSEQQIISEVDQLVKKIFEYSEVQQHLNADELMEWISIQEQRVILLEQELELMTFNGVKEKRIKLQQAKNFLRDLRVQQPSSVLNLSQRNNQINQNSQANSFVLNSKQNIIDRIDKAINKSQERERVRSISGNRSRDKRENFKTFGHNSLAKLQENDLGQNILSSDHGHMSSQNNLQRSMNQFKKESFHQNQPFTSLIMNDQSQGAGGLGGSQQEIQILKEKVDRRDKLLNEQQEILITQQNEIQKEKSQVFKVQQNGEILTQEEEELKKQISKFKIKLSKKKDQLKIQKDKFELLQQELDQERRMMADERQLLERQREDFMNLFENEKIKSQELDNLLMKTRQDSENFMRKHRTLEENYSEQDRYMQDLQSELHKEQDQGKELRICNQILEKRNEDLNLRYEKLENKFSRLKKKSEEEKQILIAENENEIQKRKTKVSKLKQEVNELAKKIHSILNEGINLKAENERLARNLSLISQNKQDLQKENQYFQTTNDQLQNQVQQLSHIREELTQALQNEQNELGQTSKDRKKLIKNLEQMQTQVENLNNLLQSEQSEKQELQNEYRFIQEQCQAQQQLIEKIEKQNQFLSDMQNNNFEKLEDKVNAVNQELNILREENHRLKLQNQEMAQELNFTNRNQEKMKEKLIQNKLTIQQLKSELDEMDTKVKEIIQQKNFEIQDSLYSTSHPQKSAQGFEMAEKSQSILKNKSNNNLYRKYLEANNQDEDNDEEEAEYNISQNNYNNNQNDRDIIPNIMAENDDEDDSQYVSL